MSNLNPFVALREEMDNLVIGHDDVKTSLLLGIISREHIYIEGPPGTAKTMLSEIISWAAQLRFFFYQLHRDTRLSELLGDLVISKQHSEEGEIIKQKIVKGGILTAEICLLDDISRAPGESLNVLLRILNERKFSNESIPLLTAIATSNPTADEYYNEPLDPANLDRFVLQIHAKGLSYGKKWRDASQVIKLYSERSQDSKVPQRVSRDILDKYYERLNSIEIPDEVQDGIKDFVVILIEHFGLNETNSLISDRTFFVKSLKIIRSHALLNDRDICTMEDLKALRYMTAFRVPEEVYAKMDEILEELTQKKKPEKESINDLEDERGAEFEKDFDDEEEHKQKLSSEDAEKESDEQLEEAKKTFFQALKELKDNIEQDSTMLPPPDQKSPSDPQGQPSDGEDEDRDRFSPQKIYASKSSDPGDEEDEYWIGSRKNIDSADNVKLIMKVLEGNFQRSMALEAPNPGGLPRKYKIMNYFDELEDADPFEAVFWSQYTSPNLPRVHKREKNVMGGEIAILRDVSTSMMGVYSEWSSSVVKGVVELARAKNMKVGYIEFNHKSFKHKKNSKFFTRDYQWMLANATSTECSGNTNYEDALNDALIEFRGRGLRNKHILFITDGIPTSGNCEVTDERQRAKKLGVCIHSIFIGSKNFPKILNKISSETSGSQFIASRKKDGIIRIQRRDRGFTIPVQEQKHVDPFSNAFILASGTSKH